MGSEGNQVEAHARLPPRATCRPCGDCTSCMRRPGCPRCGRRRDGAARCGRGSGRASACRSTDRCAGHGQKTSRRDNRDTRPGPLDVVLKADHGRRTKDLGGSADLMVVVFDHLRLLHEEESEGSPDVADVQWLVIRIEQEYDAIHCSLTPAGTRPERRLCASARRSASGPAGACTRRVLEGH